MIDNPFGPQDDPYAAERESYWQNAQVPPAPPTAEDTGNPFAGTQRQRMMEPGLFGAPLPQGAQIDDAGRIIDPQTWEPYQITRRPNVIPWADGAPAWPKTADIAGLIGGPLGVSPGAATLGSGFLRHVPPKLVQRLMPEVANIPALKQMGKEVQSNPALLPQYQSAWKQGWIDIFNANKYPHYARPIIEGLEESAPIVTETAKAAPLSRGRRMTDDQVGVLKELWGAVPVKDIAQRIGFTPEAVRVKAKSLGISESTGSGGYRQGNPSSFIKDEKYLAEVGAARSPRERQQIYQRWKWLERKPKGNYVDGGPVGYANGGPLNEWGDKSVETAAQSPNEWGDKPVQQDWGGYPSVIGKSLAQGAIGGIGRAIKGIPELYSDNPQDTTLGRVGSAIERYGKEKFPLTDTEKKSVTGQVAETIGTVAPVILGGGAGAALKLPGAIAGATTLGASQMGAMGAAEQAERARASGANPETARSAARTGAATNAALGLIPFGVILRPITRSAPGLGPWATAKLKAAAESGLVFGTVGEAQHWLGEEIAKEFYDPNAGYAPDVERAVVGLMSGAVLGGTRRAPLREPARDQAVERLPGSPEIPPPPPQEPSVAAIDRLFAGEQRAQREIARLREEQEQVRRPEQDAAIEPIPDVTKPPTGPSAPPIQLRPSEIILDPQNFQYKPSDERGITGTLKDASTFDPNKTNPITAFEAKDGQTYVANGFQRTDLAQRANAEAMPARVFREADGYTPEYMRALGAYQNIAEGQRGPAERQVLSINPTGIAERIGALPSTDRLLRDVKSLQSLNAEGFGLVRKGALPAAYAAEIARQIKDQTKQVQAIERVAEAKPETVAEVRDIVRADEPLAAEREQVLARAVDALTKSRTVTEQERATNERLAQTLQTEAARQGEINQALQDAARAIADGRSPNTAVPAFLAQVRSISRRQLEGVQRRPDTGGIRSAERYSLYPYERGGVRLEDAPGRKVTSEGRKLRPGEELFEIKRGDKTVGEVVVKSDGKNVKIEDIHAIERGKNPLGPAAIRDVKAQLKEHFPQDKTLSGTRATGARLHINEKGYPEFRGVKEPKVLLSLTPEANAKRPVIEQTLRRLIEQQVGKHVNVKFSPTVEIKGTKVGGYGPYSEGVKTAAGMYIPAERLIKIAMEDPRYRNPTSAAFHESFHAVQDLLATPNELKILRRGDARLREIAAARLNLTSEQVKALSESEVQAHAYDAWARREVQGRSLPGPITGLYRRIQTFLQRAGNSLRGLGFKTPEDIFKSTYSGEMAERHAPEVGRFEQGELAKVTPGVPSVPQTPPTDTLGPTARKFSDLIDRIGLGDVVRDLQIKATPMAARDATIESRAAAKDFANGIQEAKWTQSQADKIIQREFTADQQKRMWEAADRESVARQKGEVAPGAGLDSLSARERAFIERLQSRANEAFNEAQRLGIYQGELTEGLPSYVTRLVLMKKGDGKYEFPTSGNVHARRLSNIPGGAVRTTTPQMLDRKYLTVQETEAAARAKFGDNAEVLKNIRVLPYATKLLQEAIAGRKLIDGIKEVGKESQNETVVEGKKPSGDWFTLDHPAFYNVHEVNGVLQKTPIYVRGDYEGPLRSVLEQNNGGTIYRGLMQLKGKTMSHIMFSPMIHNQVEWGRALPAVPGKVLTGRIYFEGNKAKNDYDTMRQAIKAGLVPIGDRGFWQDITSVPELPNLAPGRSWTAQLAAAVPGLFSKSAGDAVKRSIDKLGDLWHNKLLWDRIGDLQMGLYTNLRDRFVKKGFDDLTAQRAAAHWANRYAGAIPVEAMSANARKIANVVMFSRSYTLGNLGVYKDMFVGLPRDVQAQIARDSGIQSLEKIKSAGKRKAIAIVAIDAALFYAMNSLLQSAINTMGTSQTTGTLGGAIAGMVGGDKIAGPVGALIGGITGAYTGYNATTSNGERTLAEEFQGYKDRFAAALKRASDHPLDVLNPLMWPKQVQSLSATAENEPEKQDRVWMGSQRDNTGIYGRFPAGKFGEESIGYATGPIDMIHRKLGTWIKPISEIWANDKGFDQPIYLKHPETTWEQVKNVGLIVRHLMSAQAPLDWYESGVQVIKHQLGAPAHGDEMTNVLKTLGPLAGMTFSKGARGGPEAGWMYHAAERQKFQVSQARKDIQNLIEEGKIDEVMQKMQDLNISAGLQKWYLNAYSGASPLSRRKMMDFMLSSTPEEQDALFKQLERSNRRREQMPPSATPSPNTWGDQPVRP